MQHRHETESVFARSFQMIPRKTGCYPGMQAQVNREPKSYAAKLNGCRGMKGRSEAVREP